MFALLCGGRISVEEIHEKQEKGERVETYVDFVVNRSDIYCVPFLIPTHRRHRAANFKSCDCLLARLVAALPNLDRPVIGARGQQLRPRPSNRAVEGIHDLSVRANFPDALPCRDVRHAEGVVRRDRVN